MKVKILALVFGVLLFAQSSNVSHAATSASQTVIAVLGTVTTVTANGGTVSTTIDDTGALQGTLNPAFQIITNIPTSQSLTLSATVNTTSGSVNAFSGNGTTNYIALGNVSAPPTAASVTDAQSASPTGTNNPNVIVYGITNPADITGELTYTWDSANIQFDATLTHQGATDTALIIPAGAAVSGTFSGDDEAGNYEAVITLSFV